MKTHPLATAMVIPGCHSGTINRGGNGGISICRLGKFQDIDDCKIADMRGCYDANSLFSLYSKSDIILSDEQNKC